MVRCLMMVMVLLGYYRRVMASPGIRQKIIDQFSFIGMMMAVVMVAAAPSSSYCCLRSPERRHRILHDLHVVVEMMGIVLLMMWRVLLVMGEFLLVALLMLLLLLILEEAVIWCRKYGQLADHCCGIRVSCVSLLLR